MRSILRKRLPAILMACLLVCLPLTTACGEKEPEPYEFTFVSNGDGTCYISHVEFHEEVIKGDELTLVFPDKSPEGDTVTAIRYETGEALPQVISDEDFLHGILQPMMEACGCEEIFDTTDTMAQMSESEYRDCLPFACRWLIAYYGGRDGKRSIESQRTDTLKKALIAKYPFLREKPDAEFWVWDSSAHPMEFTRAARQMYDLGITPVMAAEAETHIGYTGRGDAVNYCENIVAMEFPDTLTEIDSRVLRNCPSLRSLALPNGVKITGELSWLCDFSLESVQLPDGMTTIDSGCFMSCAQLAEVTIPDSVTAIGDYAFSYCDSLTSITIPDSVTSIGEYAFVHLSEASVTYTEIYYEGTREQWDAIEKGGEISTDIGNIILHCADD